MIARYNVHRREEVGWSNSVFQYPVSAKYLAFAVLAIISLMVLVGFGPLFIVTFNFVGTRNT